MQQNNNIWQQADKQAKQIASLKRKETKRRQIVLLCETWKKALGVK